MDAKEVTEAVESAQKVARQVDAMARQAHQVMAGPVAQMQQFVNGPVARWQKSLDEAASRNQASIERYRQVTADLDRHQHAEISRWVESFVASRQPPEPWAAHSSISAFITWITRRRRPDGLALERRRAHEHPAYFRDSRATGRLWFEGWRRALFLALADGHSLERIRAETRGVSPPRRRGGVLRARRRDPARRPFRERLRHSIFTHGPTVSPSPSGPVNGGELLVPIG
ncbi:MAG TPA: hypothetical protein VN522_01340 [Solirubrobacterales bacterium]|nr:hypothetical protein [Solirubrobacterales bacterium]